LFVSMVMTVFVIKSFTFDINYFTGS
jgi:hypothetical protein